MQRTIGGGLTPPLNHSAHSSAEQRAEQDLNLSVMSEGNEVEITDWGSSSQLDVLSFALYFIRAIAVLSAFPWMSFFKVIPHLVLYRNIRPRVSVFSVC